MAVRREDKYFPGSPDIGKDFVVRQDCFIPDDDVLKVTKTFMVGNNQFRKHIFQDGSNTIAPKAYIPSSRVPDNGAPKQGINTMFTPQPSKETSGFIIT